MGDNKIYISTEYLAFAIALRTLQISPLKDAGEKGTYLYSGLAKAKIRSSKAASSAVPSWLLDSISPDLILLTITIWRGDFLGSQAWLKGKSEKCMNKTCESCVFVCTGI